MTDSNRDRLARFIPNGMRTDRGRNVSVVVAAFATFATVAFLWVRGRRHVAIANS